MAENRFSGTRELTGTDSDPGLETIRSAFRNSAIDDEWSVRGKRGFVWWGHRLAQSIWADEPVNDRGTQLVKIYAMTDLISDVAAENVHQDLATLGRQAALNALVYESGHGEEDTLRYGCTAYVHEGNAAWVTQLFGFAAAVQAAQAHQEAELLAGAFCGTPKTSNHPSSGERKTPDDMLTIVNGLATRQDLHEELLESEFQRTSEWCNSNGMLSTSGSTGVTVELPWGLDGGPAVMGKESCLLLVRADAPHPKMGNGVLFRLLLPIGIDHGDLDRAAVLLNRRELAEFTRAQNFGSWCTGPIPYHPDRSALTYVSFLPAAFPLRENLMINFVISMGVRAKWVERVFEQELFRRLWKLGGGSSA